MKTILQVLMIVCFVSACTPMQTTRGNFLFSEDIALIQPEASTQFDVVNLLGTPTTKAVFDENVWYYVGLKTEKESFFDEKVTDRLVYQIAFDEAGVVQSVQQLDGDPVDVPLASRVTPTSGNEVTFIQQVLGNVGKFNPPSQ